MVWRWPEVRYLASSCFIRGSFTERTGTPAAAIGAELSDNGALPKSGAEPGEVDLASIKARTSASRTNPLPSKTFLGSPCTWMSSSARRLNRVRAEAGDGDDVVSLAASTSAG